MRDCNIQKNVKSKLCRNVVVVVAICCFLFSILRFWHATYTVIQQHLDTYGLVWEYGVFYHIHHCTHTYTHTYPTQRTIGGRSFNVLTIHLLCVWVIALDLEEKCRVKAAASEREWVIERDNWGDSRRKRVEGTPSSNMSLRISIPFSNGLCFRERFIHMRLILLRRLVYGFYW